MRSERENKKITYKGDPIWLAAGFSAEILHTRKRWNKIYILKNWQTRILYPAQLSYRNKGDKKTPRQTNAEGIDDCKTCPTRNDKGNDLNCKKMLMWLFTYTVTMMFNPHISSVRRLKNKTMKILITIMICWDVNSYNKNSEFQGRKKLMCKVFSGLFSLLVIRVNFHQFKKYPIIIGFFV